MISTRVRLGHISRVTVRFMIRIGPGLSFSGRAFSGMVFSDTPSPSLSWYENAFLSGYFH